MNRIPLRKSAVVCSNNGQSYQYIIDNVIGDGATGIVYDAHYFDHDNGEHFVRLKECYPYASNIERTGNTLVWADDTEKENDTTTFKCAYHKLLDMQNKSDIRNSIAHTFDLITSNNTLYSVMDANVGVVFDKDRSTRISDVLKTVLALSRVVGKYHDNGYLHLDIKPSNFLTIPETRELVILFDMDSVTAIDSIKARNVACIPYSKGWAAPEQMQGQIEKICPATDIYAIGVVLFEKVMGRKVENDDISIFADWNFNGNLFDGINPKIKRQFRKIFKKTLAASPKRRYQSAGELIGALEEAIKTVEERVYLVSDCPVGTSFFVGRSDELAGINNIFNTNRNIVALHGFAGIGKSALALEYASRHKEEYDAVIFKKYSSSIEKLLSDIEIANYSSEPEDKSNENQEKITALKKLMTTSRVLLILDNFDTDICSDDGINLIFELPCNVIITTRTDFSDIGGVKQFDIGSIDNSQLDVILNRYSGKVFAHGDNDELYRLLGYHTYAVELVAKYIHRYGCRLSDVTELLQKSYAFLDTTKVITSKDGAFINKSVYASLKSLFDFSMLSTDKKQALMNLYMLRYIKVDREYYRNLIDEAINTVNELVDLGWVQEEVFFIGNIKYTYLKLHSIVLEIIKNELHPSVISCEWIANRYKYISYERRSEYDKFDDRYNSKMEEDKNSAETSLICAFLRGLNYNYKDDYSYAINYLYNDYLFYDSSEFYIINSYESSDIEPLYRQIIESHKIKDIDVKTKINALCVCVAMSIALTSYTEDNREYEKHFYEAAALIKTIDNDSEESEYISEVSEKLCNLIADSERKYFYIGTGFSSAYKLKPAFKEAVMKFADEQDIYIEFEGFESWRKTEETEKANIQTETIVKPYIKTEEDRLDELAEKYTSYTSLAFTEQIVNDNTLSLSNKLYILDNEIDLKFHDVYDYYNFRVNEVIEYIKSVDWIKIDEIVQTEKTLFELLPEEIDEIISEYYNNYIVYQTALAFILSKDTIAEIIEFWFYRNKLRFQQREKRIYDKNSIPFIINSSSGSYDKIQIYYIDKIARCTGKLSYIAPYYIDFCEMVLASDTDDDNKYDKVTRAIEYLDILIDNNSTKQSYYLELKDKYLNILKQYRKLPDTI